MSIIHLLSVHSAVKIRPKEGNVYFDVIAVVDPVTRDAQKLAPLLLVVFHGPLFDSVISFPLLDSVPVLFLSRLLLLSSEISV